MCLCRDSSFTAYMLNHNRSSLWFMIRQYIKCKIISLLASFFFSKTCKKNVCLFDYRYKQMLAQSWIECALQWRMASCRKSTTPLSSELVGLPCPTRASNSPFWFSPVSHVCVVGTWQSTVHSDSTLLTDSQTQPYYRRWWRPTAVTDNHYQKTYYVAVSNIPSTPCKVYTVVHTPYAELRWCAIM